MEQRISRESDVKHCKHQGLRRNDDGDDDDDDDGDDVLTSAYFSEI